MPHCRGCTNASDRAKSNYHNECGNTQALSRSRVQVSLWPGKNHKRLPSDELQLIIFTSFQWAPLSPWAHMYMYVCVVCTNMCGTFHFLYISYYYFHRTPLSPRCAQLFFSCFALPSFWFCVKLLR